MRSLAKLIMLGVTALVAPAMPILISSAQAWSPPVVGQACAGMRAGGGAQASQVRIAGNYLGGKAMRDGLVDRKSFQACFDDVALCERWLAAHAIRYPLQPGFARCTPVTLR